MKNAPQKVLIVLLISGIVSILGVIFLNYQVDLISEKHNLIMSNYTIDREYTSEIRSLIYKHQSLLGHIVTKDTYDEVTYKEEALLREKINELIVKLHDNMPSGRDLQLFHKVYSNYVSYCVNVDKVLVFCREHSVELSKYYYNEVLGSFINEIDTNLDNLDLYSYSQIIEANNELKSIVFSSKVETIILISIVIIITVTGTFFCVGITTSLDKAKTQLEKKVEEKNAAIRKHIEKIVELQDGIIIGMANLIESRDGDTGEHVKRTSAYVDMIARKAKDNSLFKDILTDDYIEKLVKAAPLHDVGKIAIPDSILMKPGKLTKDEFELIKTHSTEGGIIIRDIFDNIEDKDFVNIAVDIASYHHEKWNGEGYMSGLSGENIPLCARIMALADVFDALVSKRCYKDEYPVDEAFNIIKDSRGTHFDPVLTDIFISLRPQIEEYLSK